MKKYFHALLVAVLIVVLTVGTIAHAASKNQQSSTTQSVTSSTSVSTQSVSVNSTTPGGGQAVTITDPYGGTYSAYLHLPSDYNTSNKSYPLLVFLHGMGEAGTDLSLIYNNGYAGGPAYLVEHGQLGKYTNPVDGKQYEFIVLAPQTTWFSTSGASLNNLLKGFVPGYRIDTNRIYLTGLSAGGQGVTEYMVHSGWTNQYTAAAVIPMSEAWYYPSGSAQTIVNDKVYNWGFGSDPEDRFGTLTKNLMNEINAISPGMARYTNYSGGHCCWNTFYNPGYTENVGGTSMNIYQWLLQYVRGGSNPTPTNQAPSANAGSDKTITLPTNSVTLSGSGTDSDGSIASYVWSQVNGPSNASIGSASSASTSVSNLIQGTYTFQLKVTDNQGATGTDTVTVTVNAAPTPSTNTPFKGSPFSIPGTIQAEDYDLGGEGVAYHDYDPGNATNVYRPSEGVDLSTTADTGGGYLIGWISADEWQKYSVNVSSSGTYTLQARLAGFGGSFKVEMDGTTIATISAPVTNGWDTWQTVSVPNISLSSGNHVMRLYTLGSGYNLNWISFAAATAPANQAPSANAGSDKTITLPTNSVTLSGSGTDSDGTIASYAWSQVSGPSTATFSSTSTASPTVSNLIQGTYTFRLKVTDNAGATGTDDVNVVVNAEPVTPPSSGPYGGTAWAIPGVIQSEDYDLGGEGVAYHDADSSNYGGKYRTADGVDLETAYDPSASGYNIGWIAAGEWMKYTVKVASTGTYTMGVRVASVINGSFDLEVDGTKVATAALPTTGGYQAWQTATVPNISLTQGTHVIRINLTSNGYNLNWISFAAATAPANQAPSANAGSDKSITLPTSSVTLSGSGTDSDGTIASYAWSQVSGPSTATFSSTSTASPTVSNLVQGTYTFRLKVTDNAGATGTDDVNVVVNAEPVTSQTATYNIDFGSGSYMTANAGWNNVTNPAAGAVTALVDSAGQLTSHALQITDSFYSSTVNTNGTTLSTLFPVAATQDSFFLGTLNGATDTSATMSLTGLNNANTYDFRFYASRLAGDGANRVTNYTIGSTTVTLNATDNVNNYIDITNVAPTNGTITIQIAKSASAIYGYLGVLQITEHGSSGGTTQPPVSSGKAYGGTAWAIPGVIQAEDYDLGGEGIGYHDVDPAGGSDYRPGDGVDMERSWGDTSGGYNIGWVADGEWTTYTVNVAAAGTYTMQARVASPNAGKSIKVEVDGVQAATISVPQTGGWQTWTTASAPITLSAGTHTIKTTFITGTWNVYDAFNINYFTFSQVLGASISATAGCMPGAIFSFTTGQPCQALASSPLSVIVTSKSPLNVRTSPKTGSIVGKVLPATIGTVLVNSMTWPKVEFTNGLTGYVSRSFLGLYNKPY